MHSAVILICAAVLAILPAQARAAASRPAAVPQRHPAQSMLSTLERMSLLLNKVDTRMEADAAAPVLLKLHQQYLSQRDAAEGGPDMPARALDEHLARLDTSMNTFRLACARLLREKCYGSTQLGGAIRKVAQDF